jgi:hypothetical protein
MSVRDRVIEAANWWADPGEYRAWPSHIQQFFSLAGCEQVPSERDAKETMKLAYGAYLGGKVSGGAYTGPIRHWCGIFCIYLLRTYGGLTNVSWSLLKGGVKADTSVLSWRSNLGDLMPGDICVIRQGQHHFMVTEVLGNNKIISVDGNAGNQYIKRRAKFIKYSSKPGAENYDPKASDVTAYGYYRLLA